MNIPINDDNHTGIFGNRREAINSTYSKAKLFIEPFKFFNLDTINSLIVFIDSDLSEIRDNLRSRIVVFLIKKLYTSTAVNKKLIKTSEKFRSDMDKFIENGLPFYLEVFEAKKPTLFDYFMKIVSSIRRFFYGSDLYSEGCDSLREVVSLLKERPLTKINNFTLPSPMEEYSDSLTGAVLEFSPSPSPLDNLLTVDPNTVLEDDDRYSIPEKL